MTIPPPNPDRRRGRDKGLRSPTHRKFVPRRLCIAWERKECDGPIDCCHARDIAPRGHGGGKPDDTWCVPMCRRHHRESEKRELAWGAEMGIDVRAACLEMALASRDKRIVEAAKAIIASEKAHAAD
jgi:hypothetical protein